MTFGTCFVIRAVNPPTKTYRWIFPDTMHGEFLLRCKVPGAPTLPLEDGFRLVRFSPGLPSLDTADDYVFGNEYFEEEFYTESALGRHRATATCRPSPSLEHVRVDVRCTFP